jgi:hypothetical protein
MRRLLVVFAVASLLGAGALAPATAAGNEPRVFPPKSHPYGLSYGQWQARWFKWLMEIPVPDNPALDETGANCNVRQTGRVWFTAATFSLTTTRSCTISAGQAVLVFAVGNECSDIEPPPFFGDNEADLRECAAAGFDEFWPTSPSITVDGAAVPDITRFRTQTPVFGYTLPEDNLLGAPAGTTATKAISDGIAVMLKPLSPGRHRVVISYESPFLPGPGTTTYDLTVVGKHSDG